MWLPRCYELFLTCCYMFARALIFDCYGVVAKVLLCSSRGGISRVLYVAFARFLLHGC